MYPGGGPLRDGDQKHIAEDPKPDMYALRETICLALIASPSSCSGYDVVERAKEICAYIAGDELKAPRVDKRDVLDEMGMAMMHRDMMELVESYAVDPASISIVESPSGEKTKTDPHGDFTHIRIQFLPKKSAR